MNVFHSYTILPHCSIHDESPTYVRTSTDKHVMSYIDRPACYVVHRQTSMLYNTCQSGYRPGHSTETALLKVVNDLFLSLNKGNISVLALLDLSSAFENENENV